MTVLYVRRPGSEISVRGERLQVFVGGMLVSSVPFSEVQRIALIGPVQISSNAIQKLLAQSCSVIYFSRGGRYLGTLNAVEQDFSIELSIVNQLANTTYRIEVAKTIARAKISNQRGVLRRQARTRGVLECVRAADHLSALLSNLQAGSATLPEIMGMEGRASAVYFSVFKSFFVDGAIVFSGRNRRPPRDPVNALLSLGYMLALGELSIAIRAEGLPIHSGLLHEPRLRRPSLALDLLEIFRQPLVDRFSISLMNRRILSNADFSYGQDGCRLTETAITRYFAHWEKALSGRNINCEQETLSFRDMMRYTVSQLRGALIRGEVWQPPDFKL